MFDWKYDFYRKYPNKCCHLVDISHQLHHLILIIKYCIYSVVNSRIGHGKVGRFLFFMVKLKRHRDEINLPGGNTY